MVYHIWVHHSGLRSSIISIQYSLDLRSQSDYCCFREETIGGRCSHFVPELCLLQSLLSKLLFSFISFGRIKFLWSGLPAGSPYFVWATIPWSFLLFHYFLQVNYSKGFTMCGIQNLSSFLNHLLPAQ